ncbi:DUF2937 family protein [Thalassotalea fusca]
MKILIGIIDKITFTLAFICGIQLPAFMYSYGHHLRGRIAEANVEMQNFQAIADLQFEGNLDRLIQHFSNNSDVAIQQTGQLMLNLVDRITSYQIQLDALSQNSYLDNIIGFIRYFNAEIASQTWQQYVPSIPLNVESLTTGIVCAISISVLLNLFFFVTKKVSMKFAHKSAVDIQ